MADVAMFPLGSVLFPHTPLVLRVFEPRYLTMVGRLLDEEDPQFGVVLIERGHEAGGGDQRSGVGTMARLMQVQAGAEDIQIVAVGGDRPRLTWDDALTPLLTEADRIVRRVLGRAAQVGPTAWDAATEISDDPVEAAWQLAAIAPLGEFDRFTLLQSTSMGALLRELIDLSLDMEPLLQPFAD